MVDCVIVVKMDNVRDGVNRSVSVRLAVTVANFVIVDVPPCRLLLEGVRDIVFVTSEVTVFE